MVKQKNLGWEFLTDGYEGIPYFKCPYCGRKISGKKALLGVLVMDNCPDCAKAVHFDNIKEEDWLYINDYYGEE